MTEDQEAGSKTQSCLGAQALPSCPRSQACGPSFSSMLYPGLQPWGAWGRAEGQLSWAQCSPRNSLLPTLGLRCTRQTDRHTQRRSCPVPRATVNTGRNSKHSWAQQLGSEPGGLVPIGPSELGVQRGSDPLQAPLVSGGGEPGKRSLRRQRCISLSLSLPPSLSAPPPQQHSWGATPSLGSRKPHQLGADCPPPGHQH